MRSDDLREVTAALRRAEDPPWPDLWALILDALRGREGVAGFEAFLIEWRLARWIVHRDGLPTTCRACGTPMPPQPPGQPGRTRVTCSDACRQARWRGDATWETRVREARASLDRLETRLARARTERSTGPPLWPPNWARLRVLPTLPARCGRCQGGRGCPHTEGALCLYATTGDP